MLEDLEDYLDQTTTEEIGTLILTSCRLLNSAGVNDYEYRLGQELAVAEGLDFDTVHSAIHRIINPLIIQTCAEMGVNLRSDTPLKILKTVLDGTLKIETWGNTETINALADYDHSPEDAFADILEEITGVEAVEFLDYFVNVSTDLIARIRELTDAEGEEPQPDPQAVAAAQQRLGHVFSKLNLDPHGPFMTALANGLRLGLSYTTTITPSMDALLNVPAKQLAGELVAFGCASAANLDQIETLVNHTKEVFELNVLDASMVSGQIKQLMREV